MALDRGGFSGKKDKAVMRALFDESKLRDGVCLVTPIDILSKIPYKIDIRESELEPILKALQNDDYFDYVEADKNGELMYCITLHQKGLNFKRRQELFRKSVYFKIFLTIIFALLSFSIGKLIQFLASL